MQMPKCWSVRNVLAPCYVLLSEMRVVAEFAQDGRLIQVVSPRQELDGQLGNAKRSPARA